MCCLVPPQVGVVCTSLWTEATVKWLLARVRSHVANETLLLCEFHGTEVAVEWSLASVDT